MNYIVRKNTLTPQIKERIDNIFSEHAIQSTGGNDLVEDSVSFEMHDNSKRFIGCCVIKIFWGQLHIKNLVIDKAYRRQGYGEVLMKEALAYGKNLACNFAFVETMSFQAPEFYQKLGFKIELKRDGYSRGTSFYYLRRDL